MNRNEFFTTESKIYTRKMISVGTILGGPIITGYLISKNFKAFGEMDAARKSFINGILGTAILITITMAFPNKFWGLLPDYVYAAIITTIHTSIGVYFLEKTQGKRIDEHQRQGGGIHSGWRAAGIGLIGTVTILLSLFAIGVIVTLFEPEMKGNKVEITENKNRVYYEGVDQTTVESIVDTLKSYGLFDLLYDYYFKIEAIESGYRLSFPTGKNYWGNPEIIGFYAAYKSYLERSSDGKKIEIVLFQDGFKGRESREISYDDSLPLYWMKTPAELETDSLITERVIAYLSFWEHFFTFGIQHDLGYMEWAGIPTVLQFAANGVGLTAPELIPDT